MKIIEFEDCGQDFLYWLVDANLNVRGAWPFQSSIWVNSSVFSGSVNIGEKPRFFSPRIGEFMQLNYKVTAIRELEELGGEA